MKKRSSREIRRAVQETYSRVADDGSGCGCDCGCGEGSPEDISAGVGYSEEEMASVPEGANMGLGCGNPKALAELKNGEKVLDLGSGGGIDCFIAADAVGDSGRVIGVDMTPKMINRARENAERGGFQNVEFRLGEIENIPVPDNSVDVIISNCVINLSPEKERVFKEAFRILNKGGRLAITDIVATAELPAEMKNDLALHAGCVAGAELVDSLRLILERTGFKDIRIQPVNRSREIIREYSPGSSLEDYLLSASIEAVKP